jgi:uncharacterized membrane protein
MSSVQWTITDVSPTNALVVNLRIPLRVSSSHLFRPFWTIIRQNQIQEKKMFKALVCVGIIKYGYCMRKTWRLICVYNMNIG